ncbi:MAG: translation initiation factor IF-2 [Nevskiales bacterium]|nr:translation initiation factor IF-2 [Nevskiales bacterium]
MTTTVHDFAAEVQIPVEVLLAQFQKAGVAVKDAQSAISEADKRALLAHLAEKRGAPVPLATGGEPRRITLKRKETTELRVGGGRGAPVKTVSIEVRKRRTYVKRGSEGPESAADQQAAVREQTERELAARAAAEAEARRQQEEAGRKLREEEEARRRADEERRSADPAALTDSEAARRRAEDNLRRAAEGRRVPPPPAARRGDREGVPRAPVHLAPGKTGRRDKRRKSAQPVQVDTQHAFEMPTAPVVRDVAVPEFITVAELANRMAVKATEVIKTLMNMGVMATINQSLDQDTAILAVQEMGHTATTVKASDAEDSLLLAALGAGPDTDAQPRAPVVTIMGHVDHGKTSLLDHIRKTRVAAGEAGGITQHIGAYHVKHTKGTITFLDTPGHAAFTRMRARGARVTDIVILVVAGDDGVMPQTREAIQHAKAAKVPVIVAVTKMDKAQSDLERVKTEMSKEDVIPEDWGGDTQFVGVSAHTGQGVDTLLDAILVQAEVLELKASQQAPARGTVIESSLEKGRGPVATVLVRSGTLNQGDILLTGSYFGRVRALFDENRRPVKSAGPSIPVEVLGLSGVPEAGDDVVAVADERKARELAELRQTRLRETKLAQQQAIRMEQVFTKMGEAVTAEKLLNLVLKADVQGSVEAIGEALRKLPSAEVKVNLVSVGVGGITESDVDLALASGAIIVAFNVRPEVTARHRIQETGVDVRYYSIIYNLMDDVANAISGLLGTETHEKIVGLAQVRDVFRSSKFGSIAGCLVMDGEVRRGLPVRVLRNNVVIHEGEIDSLRRFKDDAAKVEAGTECGIGVKNYSDVKPGDQIECFERMEVKRTVKAEPVAAAR